MPVVHSSGARSCYFTIGNNKKGYVKPLVR